MLLATYGPAVTEAQDFFQQLAQMKPPARLLEEGAIIGRTVEDVARGQQEEAAKAVDALQKAVADVVPGGDVAQISKRAEDVKKVQEAIQTASPKLAEALRNTDPDHIAEALRVASDPEEIKDIIETVGEFEYWRKHWRRPALSLVAIIIALVCGWRSIRRRCRRKKHACVVLPQSDRCLLEVEDPEPRHGLFARAASPSTL